MRNIDLWKQLAYYWSEYEEKEKFDNTAQILNLVEFEKNNRIKEKSLLDELMEEDDYEYL